MSRFGKEKLLAFFLFVMLFTRFSWLPAQETTVYTTPYADFNLAMELYDKEKYSAAQNYFDKVVDRFSGERSEVAINARYYSALCAMNLFNNNAENLLIEFIRDYPENPRTKTAYFQLGKYWFRKRQYDDCIVWFNKVSIYDLDNEEVAEYYFKLGYSHFMEGNREAALKAFYEIKDADTRFTPTARYYYAHLSYLDGKYETSLIDFKKIEHHPKFSGIVPYYIAQIYYLQGKYDTLLAYAPPLLDSANMQRSSEISRLIGESYYKTKRYKEAIPYLEKYLERNVASNEDAYELGYAYYKSENYQNAIDWFQKAVSGKDSLSQLSYYHMADCYLELGNKEYARNSLGRAADMDFDSEVKEEAMFGFAKLAYELSYHPYNDAIRAFEKYINTYPDSKRISRAHEYLLGVYFTTKNYEEALKSLNRIQNRNYKLEKAYQRVAYYRAVELFNQHQYEMAIEHFDLALTKNHDPQITLSCYYWKAEAWYRIFKYDEAIAAYNQFLTNPSSIKHEEYASAYYGEGYAQYRKKNYSAAIASLRNFVRVDQSTDVRKKNDALLRIGDCYFINMKYDEAIEYYDKAILIGKFDTDYALFQSGVANGVVNNKDEKANLLLTLIEGYKESPYRDDAMFELGEVYIEGNREKALGYYKRLVDEYPNSSYQSKAHLKIGLIYYNQAKDDQAINTFKHVASTYRETQEANEAITMIQKIYTSQGDMTAFQNFVDSSPQIKITQSSIDSARYEIAENNYMNGKCDEAVRNFTAYIERDTAGTFISNARFYRAECEFKGGFFNEALIDYTWVLQQPRNKFTESSLKRAANISYKLEKFETSRGYYEALEQSAELPANRDEARRWLARLNFKLERYEDVIKYGKLVQEEDKLDQRVREEMVMLMAESYEKLDNYNKAYELFLGIADNNSEAGAKAKYHVASIEYLRGNYAACEEWVMKIVNQIPASDYWIAKGFILLADKYVAENDLFQAKYTLQSIIENYDGADLREVAQSKLDSIIKSEESKKQEKIEETKPEEVIINDGDDDYDYLFEDEEIEE